MLLEGGANVDAQSGIYRTALNAASSRGHNLVAEILLGAGAR